jgi:hypothetical protein
MSCQNGNIEEQLNKLLLAIEKTEATVSHLHYELETAPAETLTKRERFMQEYVLCRAGAITRSVNHKGLLEAAEELAEGIFGEGK